MFSDFLDIERLKGVITNNIVKLIIREEYVPVLRYMASSWQIKYM